MITNHPVHKDAKTSSLAPETGQKSRGAVCESSHPTQHFNSVTAFERTFGFKWFFSMSTAECSKTRNFVLETPAGMNKEPKQNWKCLACMDFGNSRTVLSGLNRLLVFLYNVYLHLLNFFHSSWLFCIAWFDWKRKRKTDFVQILFSGQNLNQ